jgi:hypothetical protein
MNNGIALSAQTMYHASRTKLATAKSEYQKEHKTQATKLVMAVPYLDLVRDNGHLMPKGPMCTVSSSAEAVVAHITAMMKVV